MVTHLEPDILECEVKWNQHYKQGDAIPVQLFQILKDDDAVKGHSICQQMENPTVATGLKKVGFHYNQKEGQGQRMFRLPYTCSHFTC